MYVDLSKIEKAGTYEQPLNRRGQEQACNLRIEEW